MQNILPNRQIASFYHFSFFKKEKKNKSPLTWLEGGSGVWLQLQSTQSVDFNLGILDWSVSKNQ